MISIFLVIFVCVLTVLVVWLFLEHVKLKREIFLLSHHVESNNKDIAGICSAAISVDDKVYTNRALLVEMLDKIDQMNLNEYEFNPPYYAAIQKIKEGVSAEEIIRQYELSHEEVDMLIRLHS